jgi:hypothetical protein
MSAGLPGWPGEQGRAGGAGGRGGGGGQGGAGDPVGPGGRGGAGGEGGQGEKGERGERGPGGRGFSWRDALVYTCCFIAIGATTAGWIQRGDQIDANQRQIAESQRQLEREGRARRSATCRSFEGNHRQEVQELDRAYDSLARTYGYIDGLSAAERKQGINAAIVAALPRQETETRRLEDVARNDQYQLGEYVPAYCDEPNVGLPEPDPKLPKPPRIVSERLHR